MSEANKRRLRKFIELLLRGIDKREFSKILKKKSKMCWGTEQCFQCYFAHKLINKFKKLRVFTEFPIYPKKSNGRLNCDLVVFESNGQKGPSSNHKYPPHWEEKELEQIEKSIIGKKTLLAIEFKMGGSKNQLDLFKNDIQRLSELEDCERYAILFDTDTKKRNTRKVTKELGKKIEEYEGKVKIYHVNLTGYHKFKVKCVNGFDCI